VNRPRLVVVGNGMAGIRTVEALLEVSPQRYDITIFGAGPYPNYDRLRVSEVLTGEKSLCDIVLNRLEWYEQNGIRLHLGKPVRKIDRTLRRVITSDGTVAFYDRLLIATGSTPITLPVPGNRLRGVIIYHDICDTHAMINAAVVKRHAVVIGDGLLAFEAANGLKRRGMNVTVVQHLGMCLERQFDATTDRQLRHTLEMRGIEFVLSKPIAALIGNAAGAVAGVRFADGETLCADLVVIAAGTRPNVAVAQAAGLECKAGIVVGDELMTSDPHIYAAGECVSHRGMALGLVAPLLEHARAAADHLALIKVCACHLALVGTGSCTRAVLSARR
jgi:nitrite reductase (NADH) large subunit